MVNVAGWLRKGMDLVGYLVLVPVGLVLVVLLAVLARPLFVAAAVVTLLGVACYAISPRFRRWLDAKIDDQVHYKGLRLGTGIAMHPSHSWARILPRHVLVGADDLVQATLGPVEAVDLPMVGSRVEEGDQLFSLRHGNRCVEVRAPITGTVLARNESLLKHPGFVNDEPFYKGWAVRLRAENIAEGRKRLYQGSQARDWFKCEIDRFLTQLQGQAAGGTSLADGGALVGDLHLQIDDDAWKRLKESFFVPASVTRS